MSLYNLRMIDLTIYKIIEQYDVVKYNFIINNNHIITDKQKERLFKKSKNYKYVKLKIINDLVNFITNNELTQRRIIIYRIKKFIIKFHELLDNLYFFFIYNKINMYNKINL